MGLGNTSRVGRHESKRGTASSGPIGRKSGYDAGVFSFGRNFTDDGTGRMGGSHGDRSGA